MTLLYFVHDSFPTSSNCAYTRRHSRTFLVICSHAFVVNGSSLSKFEVCCIHTWAGARLPSDRRCPYRKSSNDAKSFRFLIFWIGTKSLLMECCSTIVMCGTWNLSKHCVMLLRKWGNTARREKNCFVPYVNGKQGRVILLLFVLFSSVCYHVWRQDSAE
jgi:hypothetical protein